MSSFLRKKLDIYLQNSYHLSFYSPLTIYFLPFLTYPLPGSPISISISSNVNDNQKCSFVVLLCHDSFAFMIAAL